MPVNGFFMKKSASKPRGVLKVQKTYARPSWVPKTFTTEAELCPDCFKVVGDQTRYKLVRMLGGARSGMAVHALTKRLHVTQPTVTHHLQVLRSVGAVDSAEEGRRRIYKLNRGAHCFAECKIPY